MEEEAAEEEKGRKEEDEDPLAEYRARVQERAGGRAGAAVRNFLETRQPMPPTAAPAWEELAVGGEEGESSRGKGETPSGSSGRGEGSIEEFEPDWF